jgi:phytochromobilin:ferredoxin oxidoreductase
VKFDLVPHCSQEKFKFIKANEDNTVVNALSFSTPKIRLIRSLTIEQKNSVQVFGPFWLFQPVRLAGG